jgi:NAD(P)H-dependent FMN reductase
LGVNISHIFLFYLFCFVLFFVMSTSALVPLVVSVLHGSVRTGRFGIGLANLVVEKLKSRGHTVNFVDALEVKLPLLEKPFHHYKPDEVVPENIAALAQQFNAADAFIIVDGEYNHGPTPGILNLLDHFYHGQYKFKVAGIATYGASAGGARSAYALRNTLGELGLVTAPTLFTLPNVWAAIADGKFSNPDSEKALDKFVNEWEFFAAAVKAQRERGLPQ